MKKYQYFNSDKSDSEYDKKNKLISIGVSLTLHIIVIIIYSFSNDTVDLSKKPPVTITINTNAIKKAQETTVTKVFEKLNEIPPQATVTEAPTIAAAEELAAESVAIDGLEIAKDINLEELEDSTVPMIKPDEQNTDEDLSADNSKDLTQLTSVPFDFSSFDVSSAVDSDDSFLALDESQAMVPTLEVSDENQIDDDLFADIPFKQIPTEIKITEALNIAPQISDLKAVLNNKDFLAGVTPSFKKAMSSKLTKGLEKIRPIIERKKYQGKLVFQFTINRSGKLVSSKITKSSGNRSLDQLVLNMIRSNSPYAKLPSAYQGDLLKFSYPVSIKY